MLTSYEIYPTLSCSMIVELFLEFEKHMKDLRSIADSFSQFYSIVLLKTLKLLFVETKRNMDKESEILAGIKFYL